MASRARIMTRSDDIGVAVDREELDASCRRAVGIFRTVLDRPARFDALSNIGLPVD